MKSLRNWINSTECKHIKIRKWINPFQGIWLSVTPAKRKEVFLFTLLQDKKIQKILMMTSTIIKETLWVCSETQYKSEQFKLKYRARNHQEVALH